ncbi:BsuPI-related putative proteinase inhibitor [Fervidibacillus albus]|uniref:Intracellular proteinase inhibitor BsuPI domain-containing protein n=1 Tax=Fervidibacillus albus TaxID=2980026 RepID=A0A9E8LTN3_9BACI|nr:BsuPI-related putative proteinase inhibitor [Fervidibacillus albus]WAA09322.1 BsuPI-related putative proteinase inhibitor [Fervidibacillus albus]
MGEKGKVFILLLLFIIPLYGGCGKYNEEPANDLSVNGDVQEGEKEDLKKRIVKKVDISKPLLYRKKLNGEIKENGRFQSNLSARKDDGKLVIDFTLENVSSKTETITFSSGQRYDFFIYNDKNELLYQWSEGKMFTMAIESVELNPNETLHFTGMWNFVDRRGNKVDDEGEFRIVFKVTGVVEGEDGINEDLMTSISIDMSENRD